MDKVKISEIAAEIARTSKEVIEKAKEMGFNIKNATSSVSIEDAEYISHYVTTGEDIRPKQEPKPKKSQSSQSSKETKKTKESKTSQKASTTKQKTDTKEATQEIKETSKKIKETQESKKQKPLIALDSNQAESKAPATQPQPKPTIEKDSSIIQRSTGIRIVRKTDESKTEENQSHKKRDYAPSIQEMIGNIDEQAHKKAKKPKKVAISHKDKEQKIDILERNLEINNNNVYDDEQDEIMLFDLNEYQVVDEEKEAEARQAFTDRVKIQRKNPWLNENRSISRSRRKKPPKHTLDSTKVAKSAIIIPEEIRVYEFADAAGRALTEVIKVLFNLGLMVTKNDFLDRDAIEILADEFKIEVSIKEANNEEETEREVAIQDLETRPPVVTIMGHVDHGKTSLLDKIRDTRVAHGEAGGITQHIGAYMVEKDGKLISFIDTPGHEAFSEMRSRGAQVTDIAVIVIAADDGVKQQTIEALNHAKAANVQIIIAMNKMDKENANPDKLKSECAELGFVPNDWGGEYEFIPISAKTGEGIDLLLETILLQAEVMELKASPKANAQAIVLEGSIQKGRGPVATIIVKQGTIRIGDPIYAGTAYGRIRALIDDLGNNISELKPSGVALVAGLSEVPSAGSMLYVVENDSIAREKAQKIANYLRQKELSKSTKVSFDELSEMVAKGQIKTIPLVVKADTQGSLEAIRASLLKLNNQEVEINIIGFGVGGISESDVALAAASQNCVIIGFGLRPTGIVKTKAKELGVEIKTYSIIYDLVDDIKALISGLMSPLIEEENTGQAEVRDTFVISKVGTIAGCLVTDGVIKRGIKVRLIRDGVVIHTGSISSLKRFKDDVKEVAKGYECGIMLDNYNDIKVGDVFETFVEIQKAQQI